MSTDPSQRFLRPHIPARAIACGLSGLFLLGALASAAEPKPAPPKPPIVRQLGEFGDTGAKQLLETYRNSLAELRKTGGVLETPAADWQP